MFEFEKGSWVSIGTGGARAFICWNCSKEIASEKYYHSSDNAGNFMSYIYICPNCNAPLISDDEDKQIILSLPGIEIEKIPADINIIYNEIRKSMQSNCFNGAIMLMRKLIMHIAVEEGAEEGKKFIEYIDYLCEEGIVPKKSKNKANSVRTLGNSTNHEIEARTKEEAQNCFEFIELLLKVNYEFANEIGEE